MGNTSIYLPADLEDDLDEECPDHLSRSAYIQQAIREKIDRENRVTKLESRVETLEDREEQGLLTSAASAISDNLSGKDKNE